MPNYPLLIFPSPERVNRVKRKYNFGSKTHIPDSSRQGERLSPVFQQLQNSLEARRMELQQSSSGIVPEQVLVFETVGSVENFIMAVKKIDGMEWLSEVDIDDIVPDSDFYDADNRDAILTGRLYMIMTNQQAMNDLLSLWGRYNNDPNMSFDRGLAPFKNMFVCLKNIRKWDVQDRLIETGVIEAWKEDLLSQDRQSIPFEIELWFRNDVSVRNFNQQDISQKIHDLGGQVLSTSVIEPIAFHGVLGELPRAEIQKIIDNINNDQTIHLLKCENVMFFRPSGQFFISDSLDDGVVDGCQLSPIPNPVGEPIVGILDGLPLGNHQLLHNRLIIDDPDSYTDEYQAQERIHGTTIASLVIHGDLYDTGAPLPSPVYIRPIMKPVDWHSSPRPEAIPATNLFVDLIHRAVLRMFDGEGTEPPLAPSVKIINFSIGDQYRHFANTMSPMARLLDWLSLKYDVLFVVSSGNHNKSVRVEISPNCTEEGSAMGRDRNAAAGWLLDRGAGQGGKSAQTGGEGGRMKRPHWNHKSSPKPPPKDGFKSSYERKYADLLKTLVRDGQIVRWWHESMTLVVNSVEGDKRRYTPDFLLEFPDGKLRIVEVKGFAREDSILKFEVAAERWRCFEFVMVGWSKQGGWSIMKQYNMEVNQ